MQDKHIIWSDINLSLDDWKADLQEQYPEKNEDELYQLMYEINLEYIGDERMNLDIQLDRPILIIADLGLWNGRFSGFNEIESYNIKDCLYSNADYNEWYVDRNGDLRCTAIHHDGTNHYLYRTFKQSATDEQIDNLKNKIYHRQATRSDITRITERLGDKIGAVYGWDFPTRKPKTQGMER